MKDVLDILCNDFEITTDMKVHFLLCINEKDKEWADRMKEIED